MPTVSKKTQQQQRVAETILQQEVLSEDDKLYVLNHWRPTGQYKLAGAYFTPPMLARDFNIEIGGWGHIVDLCAGIGALSYFCYEPGLTMTCVEINPDFVRVGKKIVPEATWILADVMEWTPDEPFDWAISNPPFGPIGGQSRFEYAVAEKAHAITKLGSTFLLPQSACPFKSSGMAGYTDVKNAAYERFSARTGVQFRRSCIDTTVYEEDWYGLSKWPKVEVVSFVHEMAYA